ncbi:MAG: hypothetical protein AAF328_05410 [Planctomycetota bacterium]
MNHTPPYAIPAQTHCSARRAFGAPFWVTVLAILTTGFVTLGCTTGGNFPEPYVEGEVLRSGLSIPPGQTFVLGGGQPAGFMVQVYNEGTVPVILTGEPVGAQAKTLTVDPKSQAEANFEPGQTALMTNTSGDQSAKLNVTITSLQPGQTLGMRYVDR